ncbi:hypothetical protein [Azospirillum sp. B4]|uniref:hypothetical protein n=1 Tax=Azospirillum sp. B4 TaxID=95605 RepID=UPI000679CA5F|nr:hypothetical protein [Azospirillum sp. B4]
MRSRKVGLAPGAGGTITTGAALGGGGGSGGRVGSAPTRLAAGTTAAPTGGSPGVDASGKILRVLSPASGTLREGGGVPGPTTAANRLPRSPWARSSTRRGGWPSRAGRKSALATRTGPSVSSTTWAEPVRLLVMRTAFTRPRPSPGRAACQVTAGRSMTTCVGLTEVAT